MSDLEQRYGNARRGTRVVALVVVVAMALSGGGMLLWAFWEQGTPEVTSRLTTYDVVDEHTAVATIEVHRESSSTQATCEVAAIAEDHAVVAALQVPVTDGPETQTFRVELRTERRATSVDLLGCTTPGQPRPR